MSNTTSFDGQSGPGLTCDITTKILRAPASPAQGPTPPRIRPRALFSRLIPSRRAVPLNDCDCIELTKPRSTHHLRSAFLPKT